MKIDFKIKNDMLVLESIGETFSGNVNFYECSFDILTNKELMWICVFKKGEKVYQQIIENGRCIVPQEVLLDDGKLEIGCYATSETESFKRISTNWVSVKVSKGAYSEGTAPEIPQKDVWETLIMKNIPIIGENGNWYIFDTEKMEYVDSGRISKGEKGDKGDRGETGLPGTTNAANAVKGNAFGNSVVISDISPIEHNLDVKVKSRNMSTRTTYKKASGAYTSLVSTETAPVEVGKTYTASWDTQNTGVTCWFTLYSKYREDVSVSAKYVCDGKRHSATFKIIEKPVGAGGTALQQGNDIAADELPVSNFMLEEGETATEYTPYVADISNILVKVSDEKGRFDEHYSLPDGRLENVVSSYPSMNLVTENPDVVIDVTYNRDLNKAFSELEEKITNAIISLGGNI